jgi:DNA polymerase V
MTALVDCNNFYVSCERVFNPRLNGIPVVVLSNNDGCAISRSAEAKSLGVKLADPYFKCRDLVLAAGGCFLSSNYALYGDMSARVMSILAEFTPSLEVYSIDEAFLELPERFATEDYGQRIRREVYRRTGIPVGVGIAPTKVLAKVANHAAKKNPAYRGVACIGDSAAIHGMLERFAVEDIWGIGRAKAKKLRAAGIHTALALTRADDVWLRRELTITGLRIAHELRGHPCLPLDAVPAERRNIGSSRSFKRPVTSQDELCEAIAAYAGIAAAKARRQNSAASAVTVYLTTNRFSNDDFYHNSASTALDPPTGATGAITKAAIALLAAIYRGGHRYQKCGIILSGLLPENEVQTDLFADTRASGRDAKVSMVMDAINARYGRGSLRLAAEGIDQPWSMKRAMKSPSYTTRWGELPVVR